MDIYNRIAKRAEQELNAGSYVNLGIGIPTLIAKYLDPLKEIVLHTETGILGYEIQNERVKGEKWSVEKEYIDATGNRVVLGTHSCILDIMDTFSIMRAGHLDVAVLGSYQVDQYGVIANWAISKEKIRGIGGAMDLVSGSKKIIITMTHTNKDGSPKLVKNLSMPSTSNRHVDLIITELAVLKVTGNGLEVIELAENVSIEEVMSKTEAPVTFYKQLK